MAHNELPSIELEQLAAVTGGAKNVNSANGGQDQITMMLTALMDSIKELVNQQQNNPMSQIMQFLPMMMMMGKSSAPPPPPPAPAYAPPPPGGDWVRVA